MNPSQTYKITPRFSQLSFYSLKLITSILVIVTTILKLYLKVRMFYNIICVCSLLFFFFNKIYPHHRYNHCHHQLYHYCYHYINCFHFTITIIAITTITSKTITLMDMVFFFFFSFFLFFQIYLFL